MAALTLTPRHFGLYWYSDSVHVINIIPFNLPKLQYTDSKNPDSHFSPSVTLLKVARSLACSLA